MKGKPLSAVSAMLFASLFAATAQAQPADASTWQVRAVSNPATSASTALRSTDGRSHLAVRCQDNWLTIQFLPDEATGIGEIPFIAGEGQARDDYPFLQSWTRVESRMAYLGSSDNGELPSVLAAFFALGNLTMVVNAKDAKGAPLKQVFRMQPDTAGQIERVVRKCRDGKGLQELPVHNQAWTFESGQAANGRPVYTAWLASLDGRARIGIRCSYAKGGMDAVVILRPIGDGLRHLGKPELRSDGKLVPLTFNRSGEEWEYDGEDAVPFARFLLAQARIVNMRFPGNYFKSGTVFFAPEGASRAQVHQAVRMCNIPL